MKQGWEIKKLGEVCDFYRGLTYSKKDEVEISSTGVLRSNNIDLANNQLNLEEIKYISDSIIVPKDKKIKKGSLLICTANGSKSHLGKVALIDEDYNYAFGGFMGLMVPHKQIMTPKYFYYSLITSDYKNYIKKLSDGANINNLKFKDLQLFEIPVPSLLEQGRIVGVLDAAFAKIDALKGNAQKNLENAKALFQQVLKQELTPKPNWQTKKLGEIIKLQSGDSLSAKKMEEGPYPVYGGNGISGYHNQFNHNGEYIIVGRVGALCGNVRLVKGLFWVTDNAFILSQPKGEFYSLDFLAYYLNFQNLGSFARQTAQPVISNVALRDIQLYIPSRDEQKEIVRSLCCINQKCSKVIANAEKTIAECDALKQAVLRRAFNGEL